jgi:hypothetical protein
MQAISDEMHPAVSNAADVIRVPRPKSEKVVVALRPV